MIKLRIVMVCMLLSMAMNICSSDHEYRNNEARDIKTIKALSCMFLLLTPVSWKHVVTVPQQLQLPIIFDESQAEKFARNVQQGSQQQSWHHKKLSEKRYNYNKNQHVETNVYFCDEKDQKFKKNGNLRSK